jgi:cytochrome c oxidase subunit 2
VTIPNTPDELARWITDTQHVKPGNRMPEVPLSDGEVRAIVAYLRTLR